MGPQRFLTSETRVHRQMIESARRVLTPGPFLTRPRTRVLAPSPKATLPHSPHSTWIHRQRIHRQSSHASRGGWLRDAAPRRPAPQQSPAGRPGTPVLGLVDRYGFVAPDSLSPTPRQPPSDVAAVKKRRAKKPPYRSLSSVDCSGESTLASKPIERTAAAREHPDLQAHRAPRSGARRSRPTARRPRWTTAARAPRPPSPSGSVRAGTPRSAPGGSTGPRQGSARRPSTLPCATSRQRIPSLTPRWGWRRRAGKSGSACWESRSPPRRVLSWWTSAGRTAPKVRSTLVGLVFCIIHKPSCLPIDPAEVQNQNILR